MNWLCFFMLFSINTYYSGVRQNSPDIETDQHWMYVLGRSMNDSDLKNQIRILENRKDLIDSWNVKVYIVLPERYSQGIPPLNWVDSDSLYSRLKQSDSDFEIIITQGGDKIKKRQAQLLSPAEMEVILDQPLRVKGGIRIKNKDF